MLLTSIFLCLDVVYGQEKTVQYDDYLVESAFSDIHTPRDVFSNVRNTIRRTQCGTLLNSTEHRLLGNYQLLVMGTGLQPATLIMSAEPLTDLFLEQFILDWCSAKDKDIIELNKHSTLIFVIGGYTHPKHDCNEYSNLGTMEEHLSLLQHALHVNAAMIIATGGVKVRYLQRRFGIAENLARRYQMSHPSMGSAYDDLCASERSPRGQNEMLVRQIQWTDTVRDDAALRNMDVLLVLVACCYEEPAVDRIYAESRNSIIETLKLRSTGIHYEAQMATLVVNDRGSPYVRVPANSKTFIWLPEGDVGVIVFADDSSRRIITSFNVSLNEDHRYERRKILKQ